MLFTCLVSSDVKAFKNFNQQWTTYFHDPCKRFRFMNLIVKGIASVRRPFYRTRKRAQFTTKFTTYRPRANYTWKPVSVDFPRSCVLNMQMWNPFYWTPTYISGTSKAYVVCLRVVPSHIYQPHREMDVLHSIIQCKQKRVIKYWWCMIILPATAPYTYPSLPPLSSSSCSFLSFSSITHYIHYSAVLGSMNMMLSSK